MNKFHLILKFTYNLSFCNCSEQTNNKNNKRNLIKNLFFLNGGEEPCAALRKAVILGSHLLQILHLFQTSESFLP